MSGSLSFADFQAFIRQHYHERDSARGTPATFMWLMEEIGELATALHHAEQGRDDTDLAGEFADVLGWLATLANMHGVDLEEALHMKYLDHENPDLHK
jgi:NTP pyrophosphatase (non-canonical NTP hydrolase)